MDQGRLKNDDNRVKEGTHSRGVVQQLIRRFRESPPLPRTERRNAMFFQNVRCVPYEIRDLSLFPSKEKWETRQKRSPEHKGPVDGLNIRTKQTLERCDVFLRESEAYDQMLSRLLSKYMPHGQKTKGIDDSDQETISRDPLEYFKKLYRQDRVSPKSHPEECYTLSLTVRDEASEAGQQLEPGSQTQSQSEDNDAPESSPEARDLQADHSSAQKPEYSPETVVSRLIELVTMKYVEYKHDDTTSQHRLL